MYVATGKDYADALTGAALAAKNKSGILLVHDRVPDVTSAYIQDHDPRHLTLFGGEDVLNDEVYEVLMDLLQQ